MDRRQYRREASIMKQCSSCQRFAANRFEYCPTCGARLPDAEAYTHGEDSSTQLFDFGDWAFTEEPADETPPMRRLALSDSAFRVLLIALAVIFLVSAITFAVLLLRPDAPPSAKNEYGGGESTANVIIEVEDAETPAASTPVPATTPFQAPVSTPVQMPGRSGSAPVTTPFPAVTPAPLPRP
jgi:hypothetical protein